ncbi:14000_t:CDS:2 [Gigaspora rosea]|nr:14000_t:CDS:2 [Gigaspora rosea]
MLFLALIAINMVAFANPYYRRDAFPLIKKRQTCEMCQIVCTEANTIDHCVNTCEEQAFCTVFVNNGNVVAAGCFLYDNPN